MKKGLAAVLVAAIMAAMFVLPADARPKKQKRPNAQKRYELLNFARSMRRPHGVGSSTKPTFSRQFPCC